LCPEWTDPFPPLFASMTSPVGPGPRRDERLIRDVPVE